MKILVINAGSSSLKYQLINMDGEITLAKGNCERIGLKEGIFTHKTSDGRKKSVTVAMKDHIEAFEEVQKALTDNEFGVIKNLNEIKAIGHRVVQGGTKYNKSVLINDDVIETIKQYIHLAPLHNGANAQAIEACIKLFGKDVPQIAVFDTSFHATMPQKAYMFAVPYKYYEDYGVRRYGFHGTSHRYVSDRCAKLMGKDLKDIKVITCHLGNGSSLAAIGDGEVKDTSMGLTPLDGIMMGTRSGTLDPSVVTFIQNIEKNMSVDEINNMLNKQSGLLGISGLSSDDRDLSDAADNGNERAILAHDMLAYQITKFVGQYAAVLNGCDAIVFTAGIGENQPKHRGAVCKNLGYLGVKIDENINETMIKGKEGKISTDDSKVNVFVIPTNEELVIARDAQKIAGLR